MAGRLQQEIRQTRPMRQLEEEVTLNIVRTADVLMLALSDELRPFALSATQYNVLRILRGAGETGVCAKEIADRLVTRDPDITRIVDRLEKRGLVTRDRAKEDRRFVTHRLTQSGMELVNEMDRPIAGLHRKLMRHVKPERLRELIALLEEVRSAP